MAISFNGQARKIQDLDLPAIGRTIGVGEDEIHAIFEVESSGSGFDKKGRPKMLFEPHVFYRCLPAGPKRDQAVRLGLAYAEWRKGYPADSYPRLLQAMEVDETAALKAASWGLGQILGENHRAAGYPTVQAMVADFTNSETAQLRAMVSFIKANKLDDEVREHRWAAFAWGYNGPQHAANDYYGRLARAFEKWQRIRDTPFTEETLRRWAEEEESHKNLVPPAGPPPVPPPSPKESAAKTAGKAVVAAGSAGGVAGTVAAAQGVDWTTILTIGGMFAAVATALFFIIRSARR